MYATLLFTAAQILALIIFVPIVVRVKYHFSLDRSTSVADIRVYGIRVASVKLETKNQKLSLSVNGKKVGRKLKAKDEDEKKKNDKEKSGFPVEKIPEIFTFIKAEKIIGSIYILALIGGNDAKSCAVKIALLKSVSDFLNSVAAKNDKTEKGLIVPDFETDRLEFDLQTRARVNLYQLFELAVLLISNKKVSGNLK